MGVGEDWSEAARKRDRAYQEDGRSRGSYVADQDDATSERAHLEKVWAQASASGVRYSRGTNKMTSAVVAQSYSPPSLLLANTVTFHCSATSKSGGEQERETRIRNISSPRLVHSVRSGKWREILKLPLI